MRRHLRRLFWMGVLLVVAGLVFYIAAQWTVKNPLSFRAVELLPSEGEGRHTLHYEVQNESMFPVVVHGLTWADFHADGSMGRQGPAFASDTYDQKAPFTLAPGEIRREVFSEANVSLFFPGTTSSGKEIWLSYVWEPAIRERMSPLLMWIDARYMRLQVAWKGSATPSNLTKRRIDVTGPALVPAPSKPKGT